MESDTPGETLTPQGGNGTALSEREHEILRLVATGASNKQIAQQLVISPNTVKVHLRNIFGKIGVATRTEATLYAIRQGLVQVAPDRLPVEEDSVAELVAPLADGAGAVEPSGSTVALPAAPAAQRRRSVIWWAAGAVLVVAAALALGFVVYRPLFAPPATATAAPTTAPAPWQPLAQMPTARSGLATTTYGNQVYALGGETAAGVTGLNERYDPATDTWSALASMPVPVADVQAAVVGGLIYLPGGRTADGSVTNSLAVYDPRQNRWAQRASLPEKLSGYALVQFEGHLYLFGGWNGRQSVSSVYEYDPEQDHWRVNTAMPQARAYAGAAVAGGKIYVVGGMDGQNILAVNAEYQPEDEGAGQNPWSARAPLPQGRAKMGLNSQADIIYLVGGASAGSQAAPFEYFPQRDKWFTFNGPPTSDWTGLSLSVVESRLLAIGGRHAQAASADNMAYNAIYTIEIPVLH